MSNVINFTWDDSKNVAIVKGDMDVFGHIREHFSIPNKQYQFQRRFSRYVPRRMYAITPTGRFSPGLFYDIKKFLNEHYKNINIGYSSVLLKNIKPEYNISDLAGLKLDLRQYQRDIVKKCLKYGRGVVVLATAGGKTLTTACLIDTIYKKHPVPKNFKCMVVVPTLNLVHQTSKDFEDYNISPTCCKWTGDEPLDEHANVIVANTGILLSSKTDTEWIKYIDLLIVDEVHMLRKGNKINKLITSIITPNKFGLTGTLPECPLDQWNIFGLIGPKLYEKNSKDLRDQDFIGNVHIQIIEVKYNQTPEFCSNPNDRYRKEVEFLSQHPFRNNIVGKLCKNFKQNSLIMVDYIEHGQLIYDSIVKNNPKKQVFYIKGEVAIQEREKIRTLMEEHNDVIVVAISKIFSTGINIKNLHYIVFAGGGKAKIKILQSIGRGLRLHNGKKDLIIVDIMDQLTYGIKHGSKRITFYKDEKIKYNIKTIEEAKKS